MNRIKESLMIIYPRIIGIQRLLTMKVLRGWSSMNSDITSALMKTSSRYAAIAVKPYSEWLNTRKDTAKRYSH